MIRIRTLLARVQRDDAGMSLVEVLVALVIFAVISLGVGASLLTVTRMTEDIRSRQVATNLATSELDLARAAEDPFSIVNGSRTATVAGNTYTITRSTSWVETSGADVGCGTGTGKLQSKRVNVTVTWNGRLNTTQPVRSDTLISPDTRINDPSLGTIRVLVLNVKGTGSAGVAVTVTPTSGGAVLEEQPAATDTDGCSYALKVSPGTYRVAISRADSVDTLQQAAPNTTVVVTAGGSVAAQFQYDYTAKFNLVYASNAPAPTPRLPENLDTTYLSTLSPFVDSGRKTQASLHPLPSGYSGIAGRYIAPVAGNAGCVSVDPLAWPAATVNNVNLAAGTRPEAVAANAQQQVTMNIPMGVVTVKHNATAYLTAVSATAPASAADPGCANGMTYTFGQVLTNGTTTIALPYGSWTLYTHSTPSGTKTPVSTSNLGIVGSLLGALLGGNVITLDPRVAR